MIIREPNKKILLLLIGVLVLCWSGCEKKTKHKILTFFFTGVPTLEEMERQEKEAEEKLKKEAEEKRKEELGEKLKNKEDHKKASAKEVAKASEASSKKVYSHTPYTDKRCNECHRLPESFLKFIQQKSSNVFSKGGGVPGVLIAPRKKLCIKCHEHFTPDEASISGLWLHSTAADGDCVACHDPHQSEYPGILLNKASEICRECHEDEKTVNIPEHSKPGECLDCHNPHFGKNKRLLKKDYQEKKYPVRQSIYSTDSKSLSDTKEKEIDPQNKTETSKSVNQGGSGE